MNTSKIIVLLLILLSCKISLAQPDDNKKKFGDEIDKIMKQKLVEEQIMDEFTADKFMELSREKNKSIHSLSDEKRELAESIEANPDATDIDTKFDRMFEIEGSILDKKKSFFQDLKSFLSSQQIAKTFILRNKFKKEIRKEFDKHKKANKDKSGDLR